MTWLRMFLIFMFAGGITIQAVLYPNYYPLDESIIMALSRAFFGMFLTKIDDLDSKFHSCMFSFTVRIMPSKMYGLKIVYKLVPFSPHVSQCYASMHQGIKTWDLTLLTELDLFTFPFFFLLGNEKCESFYDNQTKKVCYSK